MSLSPALMSSAKMDWGTPWALFDQYHDRYQFTIDLAAHERNKKMERFYSEQDDALKQDWSKEVGWLNPPYGRELPKWVKKAYEESQRGALVVMLVPARPDTRWWQDYVQGKAHIKFLAGRVKFEGAEHGAPFPSAILIYGDRLI